MPLKDMAPYEPYREAINTTREAVNKVEASIVMQSNQQATLYGVFIQNLRRSDPVHPTRIVIRGDSVTYGHDTVSSDKVAPPPESLPDGSVHTFTRSPQPWPQVMSSRLNEVYGAGTVEVINQGYSGDWFKRGYERWTSNVGAHLTVYTYGINDAQASYVPDDIRNSVPKFTEWCEKMIARDLTWGSAVAFATPTKQLGVAPQTGGSEQIDVFREVYYALSAKYGIPVIDMERMLANVNRDAWSDGNHLNTKGNGIVGSRMAAAFIGAGPLNPTRVSGGSKLLTRPTLDNVVFGPGFESTYSIGYFTPDEGSEGSGVAAGWFPNTNPADAYMYWSFYVDEPDTVIIPWIYAHQSNSDRGAISWEASLDFGVESGDNYHDEMLRELGSFTSLPPTTVTKTQPYNATATSSYNAWSRTVNSAVMPLNPESVLSLRVATPGWHTLRIKGHQDAPVGGSGVVLAVHALEFMSFQDWDSIRKNYARDQRLATLESLVTAGKGVFHRGVPSVGYTELITPTPPDYLETRFKWADVLAECGIADWSSEYFKAPVMSIAVTSYGQAVIRYFFKLNVAPGGATGGTSTGPRVLGTRVADSSTNLVFLLESDVLSLRTDGVDPKTSVACRELSQIAYDGTTKELVLTWKTTTSDGSTPRQMFKNFVVDIAARV